MPEQKGLTVVPGENLLRIHLRPKREDPLDSSEVLSTQASLSSVRQSTCMLAQHQAHHIQ